MSSRYPIPARTHRVEEEIRRSRFITTLAPAGTVTGAQTFIEGIKAEFPDATHNCWAFLVGPPGSSGHVGMSDDGEPHGTAGRPMLHVLSHSKLGDIAAVVTRYFGGVKLGKGGLVRAYSSGVHKGLESLPLTEKVHCKGLRIIVGYGDVNGFERLIAAHEARVLEKEFETDVTYALAVPEDKVAHFTLDLDNLTSGGAILEPMEMV